MERVCDLIARREYKSALVRLWHLAEQLGDAGGTTLDRWASLPVDALADKRIANFFTFGQPGITLQALQSRPTEVVSRLDQRLHEERRKASRPTRLVIEGRGYFLVPCTSHNGFEQEQPVRFANYMRHHRIIPDRLPSGVTASVRDLCEHARLQQQLEDIVHADLPALQIGLGLFPDRHRLQGESTRTDATRQRTFFTATSDDAARLASAREQIRQAEAADVELLVFPELTLSPDNQRAIEQDLFRRWCNGEPCRIALILLGSFHCHDDSRDDCKRNRARLLWGFDGSTIAAHDKFSPATLGELTEDFTPGTTAVFLCTPIGNISLAICKDIIDDYASIWLEKLGPNWLLVPSLSDSASEHAKASRRLWNRHRCISVVANQPLDRDHLPDDGSAADPVYGYVCSDQMRLPKRSETLSVHPVSLPHPDEHPPDKPC